MNLMLRYKFFSNDFAYFNCFPSILEFKFVYNLVIFIINSIIKVFNYRTIKIYLFHKYSLKYFYHQDHFNRIYFYHSFPS